MKALITEKQELDKAREEQQQKHELLRQRNDQIQQEVLKGEEAISAKIREIEALQQKIRDTKELKTQKDNEKLDLELETKRMREQKNLELAAVQKLSVDIDAKTNECIKQRELKDQLEQKEKNI